MDAPEDRAGTLSRFGEGPSLLEAVVMGLEDDVLDSVPAGGGWTIRQIVHHVVDGDDIWKLGIKMAMGTELAEFPLGWYMEMSQEAWNRAVLLRNREGKLERIPVGFVIQMQADHLFHHVQRIRDILKERGGA